METFFYKISQHNRNYWPGAHRSLTAGAGNDFYSIEAFSKFPDARRIDIRATVRDVRQEIQVRRYYQRSRIPVTIIIDGSASMRYAGRTGQINRFIHSAVASIEKLKDKYKCFYCNEAISELAIHDIHTFNLEASLDQVAGSGKSAAGLARIYKRLPVKGSLVFLVSDYHLADAFIARVLASFQNHWLVPVVVWNKQERQYPRFGIAKLQDSESGAGRTVFFTPGKKALYEHRWHTRKKRLNRLFSAAGVIGFFMEGEFEAGAMTRYFAEQ